ncbi:hypothetical protein OG216_25910 [Streptomycetaceae bacterium NBC_01309]
MADITTEQITRHTVTLTDPELLALREAAALAMAHAPDHEHHDAWKALRRLGAPTTRKRQLLDDLPTDTG